MAYSIDSSEEEDLQDAISRVLGEEDTTWAAWPDDRRPCEEEGEEEEEQQQEEEEAEDDEPLGGTGSDQEPVVKMASRAYQLEMLDASLKENVVVVMDTGSGKTQVAILRMEAELGKMAPDQIIWFLAPTVALCAQQAEVVTSQIPQVQSKMIIGADSADSWKAVTWDTALVNIKIVITTPRILMDALSHGFVKMPSLALLIFDEAHHCNNNHEYSRIMKEFYWTAKAQGKPVPHILGLTAFPVFRSDISGLEKLEQTLDAVCRSPTRHRDELLAHSQRPSLVTVSFKPWLPLCPADYSESIRKLVAARNKLDIMEDPYIVSLVNDGSDRARRRLAKALKKKSTYVQDSMGTFCRRSIEMATNIGSWAADWYIFEVIKRFLRDVGRQAAISQSWTNDEVVYLARAFQDADIQPPPSEYKHAGLSDKVQRLIEVLLSKEDSPKGIVFVEERATAAVLQHVLAIHPEVSKKFRTGVMVGLSSIPGVKNNFWDLPREGAKHKGQRALEEFRTHNKNLLVATSVLEEGIDVPACNLIICLDEPVNLKSFIQRRGRARVRESYLYIFVDEQDASAPTNWEKLEAEMKRHYENEMRELHKVEAIEDAEELDYPELHIESTGARLTIHDAKSHLAHFCATLSSREYVSHEPDYIIKELHGSNRPGAPIWLKASVLLPLWVPHNVRQATSSRSWLSEKNAYKDAAFQAYAALHRAGLLDDHLLPLRQTLERDVETRPGMVAARALANPWLDLARAWTGDQIRLHRRTLRVLDRCGSVVCQFDLALPREIPDLKPMVVWYDYDTQLTLRLDSDVDTANGIAGVSSNGATGVGGHTHVLLSLAYCHRRIVIKDDCVLRLLSPSGLPSADYLGNTPFTPEHAAAGAGLEYLVRDERQGAARHPYLFYSYLPTKPPIQVIQKAYKGFEHEPEDAPYLAVKKWPRRSGFFQRPAAPQQLPTSKQYVLVIPAKSTTVDGIPAKYAQFGLLLPALFHYLEIYLLATDLSRTLLKRLMLSDVSMVVDAICASSARTPTDYERVEFLGDSILKTCITVNVAATNLRLPEGLLSLLKDRLVSNGRLQRAARDSGLDQFIVTQQLVVKDWRAPYLSDLLSQDAQHAQGERTLATKTLADVVEALIGVAYLDGGIAKALDCIRIFLPESQVKGFQAVRDSLFAAATPKNMALPADLAPLEALLEHTFHEKALLVEAVTHPSYNLGSPVAASFDRLEFIGDAILDFIIVEELYAVEPPLANFQMHLLRTALVNADILGFLVMEFSHKELRFDIVSGSGGGDDDDDDDDDCSRPYKRARRTDAGGAPPVPAQAEAAIPLWSFMRQASAELAADRAATAERHTALRGPLRAALCDSAPGGGGGGGGVAYYPWVLLARLHPQKFFSDLFEALLGAVWVDAGGPAGGDDGLAACRRVAERVGVLPLARRLLRTGMHALHPKEELSRLAGRDKVEYRVGAVEGEEGREWTCEVLIGSRNVVNVGGCLFKEEARVTAATRACQVLKQGGGKTV